MDVASPISPGHHHCRCLRLALLCILLDSEVRTAANVVNGSPYHKLVSVVSSVCMRGVCVSEVCISEVCVYRLVLNCREVRPFILRNTPCNGTCAAGVTRTFVVQWSWLPVTHNITQVAFFDMYHDVSIVKYNTKT